MKLVALATVRIKGIITVIILCAVPVYAEANTLKPFNIAVSILPQKQLVEKIGGNNVKVMVLVKPGHNPVTYEPTPKQLTAFSRMDVYFYIGVPFERRWLENFKHSSKHLVMVSLRKGIELRKMTGDSALHVHSDGEHIASEDNYFSVDPHIWLSPSRLIRMADTIRQTLSSLDPAGSAHYKKRFLEYELAMKKLSHKIKLELDNSKIREFLVFHPSWGYFADEFGLKQIAIEIDGKNPTAKSMANVIKYARSKRIKLIFVQKQFSSKAAENIAKAIDGKVVQIDPLAEDIPRSLELLTSILAGPE